MIQIINNTLTFLACFLFMSCEIDAKPEHSVNLRRFETSFETDLDFQGFYIVRPGEYDSYHEKTTDKVYDGKYSHKAWIIKARAENNDGAEYLPHRAYPTIQFHKTKEGLMRTPSLVSLWVNLDMDLIDRPIGSTDDWYSLATLTSDTSDNWVRTVLVNLTPDGYLKLVHVPLQGQQNRIFQADFLNDPEGTLLFPQKQWVRIDILIDFSSTDGYAKVWQNGNLVSYAEVEGGNGYLAQAHFGLYASPAVNSGFIYNDKLRILEVSGIIDAESLLKSDW